jgi:5,6-dimethylbenzimidazole synthase
MELGEAIQSRRSSRSFSPEEVGREQIDKIISACTWAPSPLNLQPWEFIVITDQEVKAAIRAEADSAKEAVAEGDGPSWAAKYPTDFLESAPVLIAVVYNPAKGGLGSYFNAPHGALMAASAGIQNMALTAAEMGLTTVWFTFFDPDAVGRALKIPENLELAGVMPFGYPAEEQKAPPRKPALVFSQTYGD